MKDDLSQKNIWKYDIFFKCSEKIVFPKKIALEYDLSSTIKKGGISFSRKYDIFSRPKVKDDLPQKIHGNIINISGIIKSDDAHPRKDDIGILE